MSLKSDLHAYLLTQSSLTDLVGQRIYPTFAPETATKPYIVYHRFGSDAVQYFEGVSILRPDNLQFDTWGATALSVENVSEVLRGIMVGLRTTLNATTDVRNVFLDVDTDSFESPVDGSAEPEYRNILSFRIWYFEN